MPGKTLYNIEKVEEYLFVDASELNQLSASNKETILRLRATYSFWLENPNKKDKEVIDFMIKDKMMSRVAAYEYVRVLKTLLGNINKATKDWWRYRTNTMLEYAYQRAVVTDNVDAMVKAAAQLIKSNNLDKEDRQSYEWDQIKPQTFVPTDDPTIIGIKPMENWRAMKDKLLQKYSSSITDVTYEDVDINELKEFE